MDLKKLKSLRRKKGWTQNDMADKVGIARTYYNSIERGKIEAGYKTLLRIAHALGIKLAELVNE